MSIRLGALTSILALSAALPALGPSQFQPHRQLATIDNMAEGEDRERSSSAEIISVNDAGDTLVYSDSPLGVLGFIDITDPAQPKPLGNVKMDGEPTTAVIIGKRAFVGVDTTDGKFTTPSGALRVIDLATEEVITSCDLGGQPDSVAKAADGSFLAIAIENQRDEDLNDGALQLPAGFVVKLPVTGDTVDCGAMQKIDVTGPPEIAPEDPEPEFVSVNSKGEIVVTLQENNHIVIIGADGRVASHFPAGAVTLEGVDLKSNGKLDFSQTQENRLREPDGVKWLGDDMIVTANEGDYQGSRGWTIFNRDGSVVYESGASFEHAVIEIGHYPEKRSKAKGIEPESIEVATFDGTPYIFVVSERASVIGVYDATDPKAPVLKQILPSGISPEGLVAIPQRNLIVSANEVDLGEDGAARAHVMVYERKEGPAAYPMLTSAGADKLIGWGALSGLAAGDEPGKLFAISDSVYSAAPTIYTIDATQKPARITDAMLVTRDGDAAQKLDLEGIAPDGDGGFWLASEGNSAKLVPHAVYHVNKKGEINEEIAFPADLLKGEKRFGLEGITVIDGTLWMAVQREWGDDAKGQVKLLSYDPKEKVWGAVAYPLETPAEGAWVGLSEITRHGDWVYIVERDNQIGTKAKLKALYRVAVADLKPVELGGTLPVVKKELVRDFIPDLKVLNGYVVDKVEGFAIDAAGTGWVVTDNDGVDDSSGETLFWSIGKVE